jgi:hypothetical protein
MMVTVSLDSPSCEVTLFDPVSVVYRDAIQQTKGLYRLKYVGALWSGLACLSRYNSGWFCHMAMRRELFANASFVIIRSLGYIFIVWRLASPNQSRSTTT